MACDTYFQSDIKAALVAGLVMAIHSDGGRNIEYSRGMLAMACHTAIVFSIDWSNLLVETRAVLGDGIGAMLDAAVTPVLEARQ